MLRPLPGALPASTGASPAAGPGDTPGGGGGGGDGGGPQSAPPQLAMPGTGANAAGTGVAAAPASSAACSSPWMLVGARPKGRQAGGLAARIVPCSANTARFAPAQP